MIEKIEIRKCGIFMKIKKVKELGLFYMNSKNKVSMWTGTNQVKEMKHGESAKNYLKKLRA